MAFPKHNKSRPDRGAWCLAEITDRSRDPAGQSHTHICEALGQSTRSQEPTLPFAMRLSRQIRINLFFAALSTILFFAPPAIADTNIIYRTVITTNWIQAQSNLKRFGNHIYDVRSPEFKDLQGEIVSASDSLIILELFHHQRLMAYGPANAGSFSGDRSYESREKTYDNKRIALTNYPSINQVSVGQDLKTRAKLSGRAEFEKDYPVELWDCGAPWNVMIVRTNRIRVSP